MKKAILALALIAGLSGSAFAADKAPKTAKKAKPYTLDTCIVSDEKLGEMGEPFSFVHEGQEMKLCCEPCKKTFDKDPKKHVKKLAKNTKAAQKGK